MKLLWQHTVVYCWLTYLCIVEGNCEQCPIAWVVEKWFWGQHEFHKNQSYKPVDSEILSFIMSNTWCSLFIYNLKSTIPWVTDSCTLTLQSSLHSDSTISSFLGWMLSDQPQLSVSWLNWMSLPNKLKCSHTVITLRCKGNLLCMNHKFVYVPCGVVRLQWERRRDTLLILRLSVSHVQIYIFFVFLFFSKICSKWKVTMFSERPNASFVLVGAALTFLPIERQIVVKLILARKQNKGRWDGV